MALRTIKNIFPAVRDDIADLQTRRALPTEYVAIIDPFLFLNHHGPQVYAKNNDGLPFGPHPHRGFQTVSFILKGEMAHKDSGGHESIIHAGGVQWMVAGRGLVHSEVSPEAFLAKGGPLEILQLWVNLPARLKMSEPSYTGLQAHEIPSIDLDSERVKVKLVSGKWSQGEVGPFTPPTELTLMTVAMTKNSTFRYKIPAKQNIFFYVVRGTVEVNEKHVDKFHLVHFDNIGEDLVVKSEGESLLLLCHAEPFNEPVVAQGPFVMNSREEIQQAIKDYQAGKFGK